MKPQPADKITRTQDYKHRKLMAPPKKKSKHASTTLRSTSGAGFEFEDLICAWQLVKALSGEPVPGIDAVVTQVQAQVSTLGWHLDDLLLTAQVDGALRRLAISVKGNLQVTASGLPADFVKRAWEQWRDPQGPFNLTTDGLALVTRETHQTFGPVWYEVKNACNGSDMALAMSRIRNNTKQSRVFDSVYGLGNTSEEETIELIRRLHVLPTDFQLAHSESEIQTIAQCRRLLASGREDEAQALWQELINVAKDVRLRSGTITLQNLLSSVRGKFDLRHYPNFESDWEVLSNITADYRARIETELPSGYEVPRQAERESLRTAINNNSVTVVFGESGSGKSALVKSVLGSSFQSWKQVWFGPDELNEALSTARRHKLPLNNDLSELLKATVKSQNVLIIDSAERIEAEEYVVISELLQAILPDNEQAIGAWRIIIVTQTQTWVESAEKILGGRKAHSAEVETLNTDDVKLALLPSPTLRWLVAHDDTLAALRNLKTLAWVFKAGAAMGSNASGLVSHIGIADRLWKYWTKDRADIQALMMRLAKREALFERSFALTEMEPVDTRTFTERPEELPLRKNERTNRIEFEHDLAADWARFQSLKEIWQDTPQWTAMANNPLWTSALRMLGQFLLRETVADGVAWDIAFRETMVAKNDLAGDILLEALCLDPYAERFLTERADFLFANGARHFSRLLRRFHHIATIPTGIGLGLDPSFDLYLEVNYRSIVYGRWWPVIRFLIAHREQLAGLVLPDLAKVIETWLTKTPHTLSDGNPMPYRLEMAEMALAMARTIQVEKGCGVWHHTDKPILYTATLAGVADLPVEVGNWALELAGRKEFDTGVKQRILKVREQKLMEHAKRLKSDAKYKARYEKQEKIPHSIGSIREPLPPWPLGASYEVDGEFRIACIKENGIRYLMRVLPELAGEVLLALIIEDKPEREYISNRDEIDLGLGYPEDAYPTVFWKSQFFVFLQLDPETALTSLIALVNFCTDRWVAGFRDICGSEPPNVPLQFADRSKKAFPGWHQVFDWHQSESRRNGSLYCALDALERWLTLRLDADKDIDDYIERIFAEGNSAALVSVLVNVAKYRPSLLTGPLEALLTFPNLFYWDNIRADHIDEKRIGWSWVWSEAVSGFARDWVLAPHRKRRFLDVVVELLLTDDDVARRLHELLPTWALPEHPKKALEFQLLFAMLDRANYQTVIDQETGAESHVLEYPEELRLEMQSWQAENATALTFLLVPDQCEKLLQQSQALTDDQASYLFSLLKECKADVEEDEGDAKSICRFATASTLVALGKTWLTQNPEACKLAIQVVRSGIGTVPNAADGFTGRHIGGFREDLKFIAYAVMHLWLSDRDGVEGWEKAVLYLLTSGDERVVEVVVNAAYTNRKQLGTAWWRLLYAGLIWSGLILLAPRHDDDENTQRVWNLWLARLRHFQLNGVDASPDDLDFKRILAGQKRLSFQRRMRLYNAGQQTWRGIPKRDQGGSLDNRLLEILFRWLTEGDGTGDYHLDASLALSIWDYDVTRAKANMNQHDEYDMPSQYLGYGILLKLGALSVSSPEGDGRLVWEPVLSHGPAANSALKHFIEGLFLRLGNGDDPVAFERVWQATIEYGLASNWSQPGLWFYGERLICDLLGFGSEHALSQLNPGAALRMKQYYERWATANVVRDEECIARFCRFLIKDFGAPLRIDGLSWLAAMLKRSEPSVHWYRKDTGDTLVEFATKILSAESQALSQDAQARQALIEIIATLAAKNISGARVLHERVKQLR